MTNFHLKHLLSTSPHLSFPPLKIAGQNNIAHYFKTGLFLLLHCLYQTTTDAQSLITFFGGETQLTTAQALDMDTFFYNYDVFDFDHYQLNHHVKNGGDTVAFSIYINDTLNWDFTVSKKEVFSDNFLLMYTTPTGEKVVSQKGETNTYQGQVGNSSQNPAFFYISNSHLKADFTVNGVVYIIEQGGPYTETEGYVLYRKEDRKLPPGPNGETEVTLRSVPCAPSYPTCECYDEGWEDRQYYLELAFEMDCEFVRDKIWNKDINEENLLRQAVEEYLGERILMEISKAYEDAIDMQVIGVFAHFWMPSLNANPAIVPDCTGIDPYPDEGENGELAFFWKEFREYWHANFGYVNRDWAHVFSGRNLGPMADGISSGNPYTGFSGSGSICGRDDPIFQSPSDPHWMNSYSVSDVGADWTTVAHEIGHGFGLGHGHGCNDGCEQEYDHDHCDCGLMEAGCGCSERFECFTHYTCGSVPAQNVFPYHETSHYRLCQYLNGWNASLQRDNYLCLLASPPINYEFDILIEDDQAISIEDDLICIDEEVNVSFYYTFALNNFSWDLGPGLALVSGTLNDPSIRVKGTANWNSKICANFDYNGQSLTYCQDIYIGLPPSPGAPIFSPIYNNGELCLSIGFPPDAHTSYFDYSFTLFENSSGTNLLDSGSGTTTNPDPLVFPVCDDNCVNITIKAGNKCGLNLYTPFDPFSDCFEDLALKVPPSKDVESWKVSFDQKNKFIGNGENGFAIYPNPSNGKVNIVLPVHDGVSKLRIVDMTGKTAYSGEIAKSVRRVELDGSNWGSGIYKAQLIQGNRIYQKKLEIIQ